MITVILGVISFFLSILTVLVGLIFQQNRDRFNLIENRLDRIETKVITLIADVAVLNEYIHKKEVTGEDTEL